MIPTNIIFRTIHIRRNGATGTSFVLEVDNKQYYITARHVVEGMMTGDTIEINYKKNWNQHSVVIVGHSPYSDISVLSIPTGKVLGESMLASSDQIYYGQDIFFLGFPFGLQSDITTLNSEFPIPLVKKGILSNFLLEKPRKILLLDGWNNPGFSGGPIVYFHQQSQKFQLAGIISGYRYEITNAMQQNHDIDIQIKTNTGIIISYGIEAALELIKQNPIGTPL